MNEERPVTQQPEGGEPSGSQDASAEQEMVEATEEVSGIEAERDKYLELAQRTQADFENYRKRAAKEAAAAGTRAKAGLVRELLPVLDNLERALQLAGDGGENGDAFVEGVRLVYADLLGVLQRSGVEAFDPSGEPFDPTLHEALSTRPQDGEHPGTVEGEFREV